ncbi:MAG: NADPH-dependent F420 reductase [Polyangiaceae bacterium]
MKIGIVGGTGKEGRGIALRWAKAGHQVAIGSRDAERAAAKASELSTPGTLLTGTDNATVCREAEVVLLSIPFSGHRETLEALKEALAGKIVIDITVPLKPPKVREVNLPESTSAAQQAQAILTDSKLVATLHHVSSVHLSDPEHGIECDVLAVSDHADALETVLGLLQDLGLRAFNAGPLKNAVALESLTPVLLHLNKVYGGSAGIRISGLK